MKFNLSKLLQDKYVLYIILFLAITNLVGYLVIQDLNAVIFFLIVGFLTTYFSKNMIVVLLVAMLATNLFRGTKLLQANQTVKEGLKNKKEVNKVKKDEKVVEGNKRYHDDYDSDDESDSDDDMTNLKPKKIKKSKGFQPANESQEDIVNPKGNRRVDYAATLESAYDNLQNILGPDGMQGLSGETKTLINTQKELMTSLESMTPALSQAKKLLEGFDLTKIQGLASSLTSKGEEKKKK